MNIVPAMPGYYAIIVDKGPAPNYAVSIKEIPIAAWNVPEDGSAPIAITTQGQINTCYISPSNGVYCSCETGSKWSNEGDFIETLQGLYDKERAEVVQIVQNDEEFK